MGEFNSDGHYIYYCGQESLRRNGVAIMVNKRVRNAVLGCSLKNSRMISVHFQGKPVTRPSQNKGRKWIGGGWEGQVLLFDVSRGMYLKGGKKLLKVIFRDYLLTICNSKNSRNSTENQQFNDKTKSKILSESIA